MFQRSGLTWVVIALALWITPALSQGLNRRADLVSPPSGRAGPGDLVMNINVTEALPNAFGLPSILGRRRPAGHTVVQFVGIQDGTAYFVRQSVAVNSNETTMTRTPLLIPRNSQTITNGQMSTTTEMTIVGPRPHSESQVGLPPLTIGVKVGGVLLAEGHVLRVLRINSDGSIDYAVQRAAD
jgi:hypothetical protein